MKSYWLTVAVIGVAAQLSALGAFAADLPVAQVFKAPAASVAVSSWTGWYIGGNAGYGWNDPTVTFSPNDASVVGGLAAFIGGGPPNSFNVTGALGGVQVGYNWQFGQNWVAGFETDFDFANIRGAGTTGYTGAGGFPFSSTAAENVQWFGTARARLGYLPTTNLLVYGTAGFAYGRVDQNAGLVNPNLGILGANGLCALHSTCYAGASSRTATGWVAGAGLEYALVNNWTIRAEYLFVNLGSNSLIETLTNASGSSSLTANFGQTTFNVVRGGVDYRF
jgi:outer membrane immunogenic protein